MRLGTKVDSSIERGAVCAGRKLALASPPGASQAVLPALQGERLLFLSSRRRIQLVYVDVSDRKTTGHLLSASSAEAFAQPAGRLLCLLAGRSCCSQQVQISIWLESYLIDVHPEHPENLERRQVQVSSQLAGEQKSAPTCSSDCSSTFARPKAPVRCSSFGSVTCESRDKSSRPAA